VAAAALRRNAGVLLAYPDLKVVVTGYASEEGSAEYNARLSGRRAHAAIEYLKSLGVPKEQMRIRVRGESAGRPYPLHRVVDFEFEPEK
jgi:outer membrane protein OmpA-like peptidoglycan-associated protein